MILSVTANHDDFKPVRFTSGLNVILAERDQTSTAKDSRNGLGKSSLLSIIHWILGSSTPPHVPNNGHEYEFSTDLIIDSSVVVAKRSSKKGSVIKVLGLPSKYASHYQRDLSGELTFAPYDWTDLLLTAWFGIDSHGADGLSFRSLVGYLMRRDPDGYADFRRTFPNQPAWNQQACLAFLLGIDWTYPVNLHKVKDEEKQLKSTITVLKSDVGAEILNTPSNMENSKVQLDIAIERLNKTLSSYQVHDEYRELELEANELTRQLSEISDQQVTLSTILGRYTESIDQEVIDDNELIAKMYEQVGIVMPELVVQRLDEVVEFSRKLVSNRQEFLLKEIERIDAEIKANSKELQMISQRRADVMGILNTHGALDEYNRLHDELATARRLQSKLEVGIEAMRRIDTKKAEIRVRKSELELRSTTALNDDRAQIDRAIRLFAENTRALYDHPGQLHIRSDNFGLRFDVEIDRTGSHGISKMKIFSFDLTIAQLWSDQPESPKLLMHDSVIFDGVDSRQVAAALELASKSSESLGYQYISFLNSDDVPWDDFTDGFNIDPYVKLKLSDKDPSGTLFGCRF